MIQIRWIRHIRDKTDDLRESCAVLGEEAGKPLYYPFEMGEKRPSRPLQGYLFKLPRFFVEAYPELMATAQALSSEARFATPTESRPDLLGAEYRPANDRASLAKRDPFAVDPALVERSLRSHSKTQNRLAAFLEEHGIVPRSPSPDDPNFDLAWKSNGKTWVAEIKSLTAANEEKQLRLALGQVLRYRHLLELSGNELVRPVVVTPRAPSDVTWEDLCRRSGVELVWPGRFERLLVTPSPTT